MRNGKTNEAMAIETVDEDKCLEPSCAASNNRRAVLLRQRSHRRRAMILQQQNQQGGKTSTSGRVRGSGRFLDTDKQRGGLGVESTTIQEHLRSANGSAISLLLQPMLNREIEKEEKLLPARELENGSRGLNGDSDKDMQRLMCFLVTKLHVGSNEVAMEDILEGKCELGKIDKKKRQKLGFLSAHNSVNNIGQKRCRRTFMRWELQEPHSSQRSLCSVTRSCAHCYFDSDSSYARFEKNIIHSDRPHHLPSERKPVRFGFVEIREYPVELARMPSSSGGPALTIGWDYKVVERTCVCKMDRKRAIASFRRSGLDGIRSLRLSRAARETRLKENGFRDEELLSASRRTRDCLDEIPKCGGVMDASRKMRNCLRF